MKNISNNNNTTREAGTDIISPGTSKSDSCKDGESSKSNNGVCDVNNTLQNMNTADDKDVIVSVCANCGKEGDDINNICNKCKQVRYCNAACKKKHRHKHKKDCEEHIRLATEKHDDELRIATELHDEKLFKQPPPAEDCPICFIRLPSHESGRRYQTCCGKVICSGCIHAPVYDDQGNEVDKHKCPFCRIPTPYTNEEAIEREKKRLELNDPIAIYNNGCDYRDGTNGLPQDYTKALKLWHRAAELGHSMAYGSIGSAYLHGEGVEVDKKQAINYYELSAMGECEGARYNLGYMEKKAGNMERALMHYIIAVRSGQKNSLEEIKQMYTNGHATKEDYTRALQTYGEYLAEIKSDQRDKAAATYENYCYY